MENILDKLMEKLPACINLNRNEPFNYFWLHIQKRNAKNIQWIISYCCDTYSTVNTITNDNVEINPFTSIIAFKTFHQDLEKAILDMLNLLTNENLLPE